MICERCGIELKVGDYPFCQGDPTRHTRQATSIARDEIPGGVVVENYGRHPVRFYSHTERRAYMKAHHLHEKETFCPLPGTDKDPQGIPNPKGYLDPQTLKNAEALILRAQKADSFDAETSGVMRFEPSVELTPEQAKEMAGLTHE